MSRGPKRVSNWRKRTPNQVVKEKLLPPGIGKDIKPIADSEDKFIVLGNIESGNMSNSLQGECGIKSFRSDPGVYIPKTFLDEINVILSEYNFSPLQKCQVNKVDDSYVKVTTGMLDQHNNYFKIYIKKVDSHYLMSDRGRIFSDIDMDLISKNDLLKTKNRLQERLGISINNDEITLLTNKQDFAIQLQNMIKAQICLHYLGS